MVMDTALLRNKNVLSELKPFETIPFSHIFNLCPDIAVIKLAMEMFWCFFFDSFNYTMNWSVVILGK